MSIFALVSFFIPPCYFTRNFYLLVKEKAGMSHEITIDNLVTQTPERG